MRWRLRALPGRRRQRAAADGLRLARFERRFRPYGAIPQGSFGLFGGHPTGFGGTRALFLTEGSRRSGWLRANTRLAPTRSCRTAGARHPCPLARPSASPSRVRASSPTSPRAAGLRRPADRPVAAVAQDVRTGMTSRVRCRVGLWRRRRRARRARRGGHRGASRVDPRRSAGAGRHPGPDGSAAGAAPAGRAALSAATARPAGRSPRPATPRPSCSTSTSTWTSSKPRVGWSSAARAAATSSAPPTTTTSATRWRSARTSRRWRAIDCRMANRTSASTARYACPGWRDAAPGGYVLPEPGRRAAALGRPARRAPPRRAESRATGSHRYRLHCTRAPASATATPSSGSARAPSARCPAPARWGCSPPP